MTGVVCITDRLDRHTTPTSAPGRCTAPVSLTRPMTRSRVTCAASLAAGESSIGSAQSQFYLISLQPLHPGQEP